MDDLPDLSPRKRCEDEEDDYGDDIECYHEGGIEDGATIVCTLTGQGLKDPDTAISQSPEPVRVAPTLSAVRDAILS